MYEGEVTELTPEETESAVRHGGRPPIERRGFRTAIPTTRPPLLRLQAGYGKVVSHVVIGLKTVKGTKQLKLDPTIYDAMIKASTRDSREPQQGPWKPEAADKLSFFAPERSGLPLLEK